MKFKRRCFRKFLLVAVSLFFFSMFTFLDVLNREARGEAPIDSGSEARETTGSDTNDRQTVIKDIKHGMQEVTNITTVKVVPEGETSPQNITCHAEAFFYNLTELHKEKRLVYNMVPKCGSLGVRGILTKSGTKLSQGNYYIGFDYLAPFHHKTEHLVRMIKEDLNGRKNAKNAEYIYHKHLHFIDFSIANAKTPYYMNVIRDPLEHHISLYYFQREHGRLKMFAPWHLLIENTTAGRQERMGRSYDDCVRTDDIECTKSDFLFTIIPFFCGQDDFCLEPSQRALQQAKDHVNKYFPLVGYVENLKDFFKLGEVLWPQFFGSSPQLYRNGRFSAHKTRARRHEPSEQVKTIMRNRLGLEYEFYDWVKQRFHCMYARYVTTPGTNHTQANAKDF